MQLICSDIDGGSYEILENAGHLPLAYITASVHGLHDIANRLAVELGDDVPYLLEGKRASPLCPQTEVQKRIMKRLQTPIRVRLWILAKWKTCKMEILTIPFIVVETRREMDEVKELIIIVKEYVLGLQMEIKRKELTDNPIRQQELAAYFTHCKLQLPHRRLPLVRNWPA
ncbi:unnamed protein product [Fraxinus pennsylvanica]|uniref:Coatomer alpha subunit C-terminal domain-containing protein n=1 Tax=Fraxinus pennsylvanica TaxID=56036 RepID=A0AAD1YQ20_9LAMI|nr:unnamed protein product [Fraxinus pennsylvanica]